MDRGGGVFSVVGVFILFPVCFWKDLHFDLEFRVLTGDFDLTGL